MPPTDTHPGRKAVSSSQSALLPLDKIPLNLSNDILVTLAAAITGERMGKVHAQVILRHFGNPKDPPEIRSRAEVVIRKIFRLLRENAECQQLFARAKKRAKTASILDWPNGVLTEFLLELQQLLDLTSAFDETAIYAFYSEITKGSRSAREIIRLRGAKSWCLQLTLSGNAQAKNDQGFTEYGPGDVVLIPPDTPFSFGRATKAIHWRSYWVYFRPRVHALPWLNLEATPNDLMCVHLSALDQAALENCFSELVRLNGDESLLSKELRHNLLEQILLRCRMTQNTDLPEEDPRVTQSKLYLTQHFNKPLAVTRMAKIIGLSTSRLTALFKSDVGMSLLEWRDRQRMQVACQLLRNSDLPIADIAKRVGYSDPLYFSRMFRRYMAAPPSSLRKNI